MMSVLRAKVSRLVPVQRFRTTSSRIITAGNHMVPLDQHELRYYCRICVARTHRVDSGGVRNAALEFLAGKSALFFSS
jgi:hypothetical protein